MTWPRSVLVLTVVAAALWAGAPDSAGAGDYHSATEALERVQETRIDEAELVLKGMPLGTPARAWAEASILFHRGRYSAARDALPEAAPGEPDGLRRLRIRIEHAHKATLGMMERAVGNFLYRFEGGPDAILVDYAVEALEGQRAAMEEILGAPPSQPVVVEFFPTVERFVLATGLPMEWVETTNTVAVCKWDRLMVLSPLNMPRGYPWKDTLAHEYVHLILSQASRNRAPIWFHEGSAKVLETRWRDPKGGEFLDPWGESLLARALDEGALVDFEAMHPSMAALPSSEIASLAFAQVAYAVDYILDSVGPRGYRQIVEETALYGDVLRALDLVLGRSLGSFEDRYQAHMRSQGLRIRTQVAGFDLKLEAGAAGVSDSEGVALDPVLLDHRRMQDHTRIGDLLRLRGHRRAALIEYERAELAGPYHSPALANKKARTLRALGRADAARQILEETVDLYPEFAPTIALLCELSAATEEHQRTADLAQRALAINPFDPKIHLHLIGALTGLGDTDGVKHEQRVLQILADHLGRH